MLAQSWTSRACAAAFMFLCAGSYAQSTVLDEVHTVADASHAVPVEHTFNISVAGTYQVALVDFGAAFQPPSAPAPLATVKLAITNGSTIVGTPLTAAGTMKFTATVGTYVIHVVGAPGTGVGSGPIGIQVTSVPDNTPIASFSDTLALPATAIPSNQSLLDDSFTVMNAGSYQVTLSDLQLPQPLTTLTLAIFVQGGSLVGTVPAAGSTPVALQPGVTYRIFAIGQADATVNAGLFSAVVSPSTGGASVYSKTVRVGTVAAIGSPALSAGSYTLKIADLAFPGSLSKLGAVATLNGQAVARLSAGGSQTFTAVASTYQVFASGTAPSGTSGSYTVSLMPQSGPAALSVARVVTTPGGLAGYAFDTTLTTAGTYALDLADFKFPAQFISLTAAAAQDGTILGSALSAAGTTNISAAAGPVSLLVFVQGDPSGSLLGIDLTATGSSSPVFATTQGIGQLFTVRELSIAAPGDYQVSVSDVGFPTSLTSLAVIVTQGAKRVGSIVGGGAFSGAFPFTASPGKYLLNFVAQPGGTDKAGTYAMTVAAVPIVSLKSDAATVSSGASAHLTWTSQNATACTASGGWSGAQAVSGSATSPAITASTTFTLACSGPGGSATQSVTVGISAPPPPVKSGGGGRLSPDFLLLLFGMMALRCLTRERRINS